VGKGLRSGTIGLTGSVVIAVSSVAPAYSLAAVLAGIVAVVGAKTPALFVIGFLPMLLTAFAFRELARQTPDCGSTFTWATRAIYLLKALHLNALADSMAAQVAVGALAVVVLALLCVRGIDVTERTQAVLVVVQLGMLALVSVVALVKVFSHHAGPQAVIPQWSWLFPTGLSASDIARGSICASSRTGGGTPACRYRRRPKTRTRTRAGPPCSPRSWCSAPMCW
jgi:amino acid transporter